MNLVLGKMEELDIVEAYNYYYEYFVRMVGESFFTNMIRKDLTSGYISENAFYLIDRAYSFTREIILKSLMGDGPTVLRATSGDDELVFYFRIQTLMEDEKMTITVGEIVGSHALSYEEYEAYIAYLEARLKEAFPNVVAIDFEIPNTDGYYMAAAMNAGYEASVHECEKNRKSPKFYTAMYEKQILDREEAKR